MIRLVFPPGGIDRLRTEMWNEALESVAILLCTAVESSGQWRLAVQESYAVPAEEYEVRTSIAASIKPAFGLPVEKKARTNGWSLVYCHTHPHQSSMACFSHVDDKAEIALAQYANFRSPGVPHCALVFAQSSHAARRLGTEEVVVVDEDPGSEHDRQVRAFGEDGQAILKRMRVAIVGAGGTGSVVIQQLAHLGVKDYVLIDRDTVEVTNLNRTVGATRSAVGASKVGIAERLIKSIRPDASVRAVEADVVDERAALELTSANFIFCCTDSHASRHLVNQLSYQYAIPAIDMGVAIDTGGSEVRFAGHVKALARGEPCLWCLSHLDAKQIREEMMTPDQRAADPYFTRGQGIVQPAVISINSTIASVAVTMFLSMITGLNAPPRFLVYDGSRQRLASVSAQQDPQCLFCGVNSPAGAGDTQPLPVRRHVQG